MTVDTDSATIIDPSEANRNVTVHGCVVAPTALADFWGSVPGACALG
jgi:hypothetical protein